MKRRELLAGGTTAALVQLLPVDAAASLIAFTVPAEENRHAGTLMQWPVNRSVYRDEFFLELTQKTIGDIANTIAEFEPVTMLAAKSDHTRARHKLSDKVTLWDIPTEDLWCRDAGPIFAVDRAGQLVVSHIQFNGWGRKQVHRRDRKIAAAVANRMGLKLIASGLKGEAGGVEQDGHGLLMAHESSWVNNNRNPGQSRDQIEARLLAAYGADRMIWSKGLWGQDITDYHIDSLARFPGPGQVLVNLPQDPDARDPFHQAALATHDTLKSAGLNITVIPEPTKRRISDINFVASYANYYVCNGAVIAAQFGDAVADAIAVEALKKSYPGREVIAMNVDTLGELGGGIHCATQQIPSA
jgi:agmatine deiminase